MLTCMDRGIERHNEIPFQKGSAESDAWLHRNKVQEQFAQHAFRKLYEVDPILDKNFKNVSWEEWMKESEDGTSLAEDFADYFDEPDHDIGAVDPNDDTKIEEILTAILARRKRETLH